MTPLPRIVAGATLALAFLGVAFSQRPESPPPVARAQAPAAPQMVGMAGCAATGCHGRADVSAAAPPADVWHESFARWVDRDPHARAFAVLDSALGQSILAKLGTGKKAAEDARCVACHAHPTLANDAAISDPSLNALRAEGVGCEACHGNAERWQIAHTQWTNPATRAADLKAHGMTDLNDWTVQAKTCVGCHVGASADPDKGYPVRDMNHDMIAAGHPRLEFEFVTFHQKLPKHWSPRHRGPSEPDTTPLLTAWLVGQVVTEQAYCELSLDRLAHRDAADVRRPWPEFADWNCSQCHHKLVPAAWRADAAQAQTAGGQHATRRLGQPGWIGASAMLPATHRPRLGLDQPTDQVKHLNDRKTDLAALLPAARGETKRRVLALLGGKPAVGMNWEEATRTYLALGSLETAIRESRGDLSKESAAQFADFRTALWGTNQLPGRREHVDRNDPGFKGYQRKPESRWEWEKPGHDRQPVEEIVRGLRKSLAERVQNLPP